MNTCWPRVCLRHHLSSWEQAILREEITAAFHPGVLPPPSRLLEQWAGRSLSLHFAPTLLHGTIPLRVPGTGVLTVTRWCRYCHHPCSTDERHREVKQPAPHTDLARDGAQTAWPWSPTLNHHTRGAPTSRYSYCAIINWKEVGQEILPSLHNKVRPRDRSDLLQMTESYVAQSRPAKSPASNLLEF